MDIECAKGRPSHRLLTFGSVSFSFIDLVHTPLGPTRNITFYVTQLMISRDRKNTKTKPRAFSTQKVQFSRRTQHWLLGFDWRWQAHKPWLRVLGFRVWELRFGMAFWAGSPTRPFSNEAWKVAEELHKAPGNNAWASGLRAL